VSKSNLLLPILLSAFLCTSSGSWAANNGTEKTSNDTCKTIIGRKKEPPSKTCPGILRTNEVAKHIGEFGTVEFLVDHTHECHKGLVYLNESKDYKTCFAAVIAKDARKAFPDDTAKAYAGKRVKVTGKIEIYAGTPKMILDQPTQITIE